MKITGHSSHATICKRRNPQTTPLWKLLDNDLADFEESYAKLFQKKYG